MKIKLPAKVFILMMYFFLIKVSATKAQVAFFAPVSSINNSELYLSSSSEEFHVSDSTNLKEMDFSSILEKDQSWMPRWEDQLIDDSFILPNYLSRKFFDNKVLIFPLIY